MKPRNAAMATCAATSESVRLRRAVRNRHRHAIEQASRRWRESTRRFRTKRREILIYAQDGDAAVLDLGVAQAPMVASLPRPQKSPSAIRLKGSRSRRGDGSARRRVAGAGGCGSARRRRFAGVDRPTMLGLGSAPMVRVEEVGVRLGEGHRPSVVEAVLAAGAATNAAAP